MGSNPENVHAWPHSGLEARVMRDRLRLKMASRNNGQEPKGSWRAKSIARPGVPAAFEQAASRNYHGEVELDSVEKNLDSVQQRLELVEERLAWVGRCLQMVQWQLR